MTRVLLLATTTGYQTRAFGEAAERLGVDLVFATDRCHLIEDPWQDHAIPIRFYDEDASVAAIVQVAKARPIDGVLVVGGWRRRSACRVIRRKPRRLRGTNSSRANVCATPACRSRGSFQWPSTLSPQPSAPSPQPLTGHH